MPQDYHTFNKEKPISIKQIQGVINRVHKRCPQLSKAHIAVIIKHFFLVLRMFLMEGEIISLVGLFTNLKLIGFRRENYNVVKAKLTTPTTLKRL